MDTNKQHKRKKLPTAKNEDVEFSREMADENDWEAKVRAAVADARVESSDSTLTKEDDQP